MSVGEGMSCPKAKTRDKDKIPYWEVLDWEVGRHCVEPRISLLSFLFSFYLFYLFGMNGGFAFFSISTVSSFLVL